MRNAEFLDVMEIIVSKATHLTYVDVKKRGYVAASSALSQDVIHHH